MNTLKQTLSADYFKQIMQTESDNKGFCLPENLRRQMEWSFQEDFSEVTIHVGFEPLYLNTVAFTIGTDIYILPSVYKPETAWGKEIIGHELAHVLQQRWGKVATNKIDNLLCRDEALEAEAVESGKACAEGRRAFVSRNFSQNMASIEQYAIQCYTVVPSANFLAQGIVVNNPQSQGGPVALGAIVPNYDNDTFITQVKNGIGGLSARSFLRGGGGVIPNYSSINPAAPGLSLRLSQNRQIAIQDADASNEQPKVFYATNQIINESNQRLALLGSQIRLTVTDITQTITIGGNQLRRVTPQHQGNLTDGLQFRAPQSCDMLIGHVIGTGTGMLVPRGIPINVGNILYEYEVARRLLELYVGAIVPANLDHSTAQNLAQTMRDIAVAYANTVRPAPTSMNISNFGINQYISPEIGDGFIISSLIAQPLDLLGVPVAGIGPGIQRPTTEDHMQAPAQIVDSRLTWGSHWGGVIAKDGNDVITLENYARNIEDNLAADDRRYYFQMYNTSPAAPIAQTWHGCWSNVPMVAYDGGLAGIAPIPALGAFPAPTDRPASPGARSFVNPISMRVSVPNNTYSQIAQTLYQGLGVNNVKNDHNLIAGAGDAHQEAQHILKGLYYANERLNHNHGGSVVRINAWIAALNGVLMPVRYSQNALLLNYTLQRLQALLAIS